MDAIIDGIMTMLDNAIEEVQKFDGEHYREFLGNGKKYNENISTEFKELSKQLEKKKGKCGQIVQKIIFWNSELLKLVDTVDQNDRSSSNRTSSTASGQQRNGQIENNATKKDIYDLAKQNAAFKVMIEELERRIRDLDKTIKESQDKIVDINFNYEKYEEKHETEEQMNEMNLIQASPVTDEIDNKMEEDNTDKDLLNEMYNYEEEEDNGKDLIREEDLNVELWNKFKYQITGGLLFEQDLCYIIQACKGTLDEQESLSIMLENTVEFLCSLNSGYEVLSNAIHIESIGLDVSFNSSIPWRVSIPYSINRGSNKIFIFCKDLTEDKSHELDTQEFLYEEGKEGLKLAEASLPSPNCICVVVSKRKVEKLDLNKKGLSFESKVDERIIVNVLPYSVMIKMSLLMEIQPLEGGLVNELKSRTGSNVLNNIQTVSPIVEINSELERNLLKPATFQIPIPFPPGYVQRKTRIFSAAPTAQQKIDKRPKTAGAYQISDEPESLVKLVIYIAKEGCWKLSKDHKLTLNKNGDSCSVEIDKLQAQKLALIRYVNELTEDKVQKLMEMIKLDSESKPSQFICAPKTDDPNFITILTSHPSKTEKMTKSLWEQGYNEDTTALSSEFIFPERVCFILNCRGNLRIQSMEEKVMIFNSNLPNRIDIQVKEKDRFAQKNRDFFEGYLSVNKHKEILWETLISIPKNLQEIYRAEVKDFDFKATDIINKDYINFLAQNIGEDWKILGTALKVSDETISRITNDSRLTVEGMAKRCLQKWIKNNIAYSKKADQMERAFRKIHRVDLIKDLHFRLTNE